MTPVGSSTQVPVDVRVVAATHRDLDALVESGGFRGDLLARLAGFRFSLPPLRERREDLGLLIAALLRRLAPDRADRLSLTVPAARSLFAHDWPANIRELEKALSAALALAGGDGIDLEHLPEQLHGAAAPARESLSPEDARLREEVVAALREHRGNISRAAQAMGKARTQMQRWIKRFALDPRKYR